MSRDCKYDALIRNRLRKYRQGDDVNCDRRGALLIFDEVPTPSAERDGLGPQGDVYDV